MSIYLYGLTDVESDVAQVVLTGEELNCIKKYSSLHFDISSDAEIKMFGQQESRILIDLIKRGCFQTC